MIGFVKARLNAVIAKAFKDFGVRFQKVLEALTLLPRHHGAALHQDIGIFARMPRLCERQQNPL